MQDLDISYDPLLEQIFTRMVEEDPKTCVKLLLLGNHLYKKLINENIEFKEIESPSQ